MPRYLIPLYGGALITHATAKSLDAAFIKSCRTNGQATARRAALPRDGEMFNTVIANELQIHVHMATRVPSRIAHEATHCAQALADYVAMDPIAESEGFAYMVEWFYERIAQRA